MRTSCDGLTIPDVPQHYDLGIAEPFDTHTRPMYNSGAERLRQVIVDDSITLKVNAQWI